MCGINGIITLGDQNSIGLKLAAMNQLIYHRGKDDGGYFLMNPNKAFLEYADFDSHSDLFQYNHHTKPYTELKKNSQASVGLAHRRLSIRDLSVKGHQPMSNHKQDLFIVYNGEVYNSDEIKNELITLGHSFKTSTDTEVILFAFQEWGTESFKKLNGMFAFAIFDLKENKTFLCRDRFGIKPLYFAKTNNAFIFSSELKPIHHIIKSKPNEQAIYDYLYLKQQNMRQDETFFYDIKKLPPGCFATISNNLTFTITKWYSLTDNISRTPSNQSFTDSSDQFKSLLLSSVKYRLIADVPVGTALSGGLDSSAIVASIHNLLKDPNQINTFSSIFDEPEADEKLYIKDVASLLQIKNKSISPTPDSLVEDIKDLIITQEEPFLSLGMYAQYSVMKLASETVKVTLDGQGGDEILAGYHRFFPAQWKDQFKKLQLFALTKQMYSFVNEYSLKSCFNWMILSNRKNILRYQKFNNFNKFFQFKFINQPFKSIPDQSLCSNQLKSNLVDSIYTYGLPAYLHHADRNSMRFTIESRIPFLDYRLVEFCLNLPNEYLIKPSETKAILRHSFKNMLPESVINRKDKLGFPTPQQRWQRKEPMQSLFQSTLKPEW